MNHTSTVPAAVDTLRVPGARLHYEVRGEGPAVVLVGNPMDASDFAPLADLLAAHNTVVTTDPRGVNRSPVDDPDQGVTVETRADDVSRLLTHLDIGPAVVFGSSGGAVSALALAQAHPEQVHTVIAHEPPLLDLLDDREQLHAGTEDIVATHLSGDTPGAWKKFLAQANIVLPDDVFEMMFGGDRDPQSVADGAFFFRQLLRPTTRWNADIAALRDGSPRILVGLGEASAGQLCERTSTALATALGIEPTTFPGGHTGFVEDPDTFAPRLRDILNESRTRNT